MVQTSLDLVAPVTEFVIRQNTVVVPAVLEPVNVVVANDTVFIVQVVPELCQE
jgi:hypothetical protein